jgi:predicted aldo/keto reductase-like oxidoreductase
MPSRLLGKTGVELPVLGFGTGASGQRLGLSEAVQLYEQAFQEGITYFDTAPEFAGYGKAQQQLGAFLPPVRSHVFLVTKCFEPDGERALRLLDASLREMKTDYADVVFVHSVGDDKMEPRTVFGKSGTYAALMKAKTQGMTRFVGLSGHNRPARFVEAMRHFDIDVLLTAANFADRHTYNFEGQVWPVAARLDIGVIAMKVFGGARHPAPATKSHCRMPNEYLDVAFRYALSEGRVACAVIGMATQREVAENLRRARTFSPLSAREAARLRQAGALLARQWSDHFGPIV